MLRTSRSSVTCCLETVIINEVLFDFSVDEGDKDSIQGRLSDVGFTRLIGDPSDRFQIAELVFETVGEGRSPLDIGPSAFNWVDELGTTITNSVSYADSNVEVGAVPLPGA